VLVGVGEWWCVWYVFGISVFGIGVLSGVEWCWVVLGVVLV
jgi:hypothetical protein